MLIPHDDESLLAEYDEFVDSSPHATIFQTRGWAHVKNNWDAYHFIHRTDGKIDAAMQVLAVDDAQIGGRFFYASRGPVCDPRDVDLVVAMVNEAADHARAAGGFLLRVDPALARDDAVEAAYAAKGITFTRDPYSSSQPLMNVVLEIRGRSAEQILMDYSKNTRKHIRKGEKYGVSTRVGTIEDIPEFYKIVRISNDHHGISSRPMSYFQRLYEAFPDTTRLSFSMFEGRAISTSLMVIQGKRAFAMYGGDTHEFQKGQSYQLDFEEVRHAVEAGCETYDMGGILSDDDSDTLTHFKKKFTEDNIVYWIGNIDVVLDQDKYAAFTARAAIGASRER
ncbi:lipid II:glycine glycyltransferase FemX [Trueperella abortisuis]|uniref:Lipid II:glycine glycyltransferase (Peptidoglycan interpeptide bridge formation enzyme) n=1 Tax=Trueperella abortisuis TaxID=445930 RepID=A0ABT9PKL7_9ACTO|nr:peptidoglycan bridge formation glycyltransferase FemA/FemB family protein [Trueperella abortisuis]MDP9833269.1 lipid II:glycine glycyltransferase (peptidoglycan interpeptide bridge formation enzyme) [Trueperella abortisuis]